MVFWDSCFIKWSVWSPGGNAKLKTLTKKKDSEDSFWWPEAIASAEQNLIDVVGKDAVGQLGDQKFVEWVKGTFVPALMASAGATATKKGAGEIPTHLLEAYACEDLGLNIKEILKDRKTNIQYVSLLDFMPDTIKKKFLAVAAQEFAWHVADAQKKHVPGSKKDAENKVYCFPGRSEDEEGEGVASHKEEEDEACFTGRGYVGAEVGVCGGRVVVVPELWTSVVLLSRVWSRTVVGRTKHIFPACGLGPSLVEPHTFFQDRRW